jgi:hypothetical protein
MTVSGRKPYALTLPDNAPSVAISKGGRVEFQRRDPERVEMRVPILVIKELPVGVLGQAIDHVAGERTLVHGGQCLGH